MEMKERLIKEIERMNPADIMSVYELVLDLKKEKASPLSLRKKGYLKVQRILKKCKGSLAEDVRVMREDRL